MGTLNDLNQSVAQHALSLPPQAWVYEIDRWEKLIFSIIKQYCESDSEKAVAAVTILRDWNLLDIDTLASKDDIPLEYNSAFKKVMQGLDFSEDEIQEIAFTLVNIARNVKELYNGKIQALFKKYGEVIREELVSAFSNESTDQAKLEQGITLWLQSAYGFPILSERSAVKKYCEQNGVDPNSLGEIANQLDINLGVLDFFIEKSLSAK